MADLTLVPSQCDPRAQGTHLPERAWTGVEADISGQSLLSPFALPRLVTGCAPAALG